MLIITIISALPTSKSFCLNMNETIVIDFEMTLDKTQFLIRLILLMRNIQDSWTLKDSNCCQEVDS